MKKKKRLGELLVSFGIITDDQLQEALSVQQKMSGRIGDVLKSLKYVSQEEINWVITRQFDIPYFSIRTDSIDYQLLDRFPFHVLQHFNVLPVFFEDEKYFFAVSDPTCEECIAEIARMTDGQYQLCVSESHIIEQIIRDYFPYFPFPVTTIPQLQSYDYEQLKLGFDQEDPFLPLSNLSYVYREYTLYCYQAGENIIIKGVRPGEVKELFHIHVTQGWNELFVFFEKECDQKRYFLDNDQLYVCNFYKGQFHLKPALMIQWEEADFLSSYALACFERDLLQQVQMKSLPKKWSFHLPAYLALAVFHIIKKNFYADDLIVNDLHLPFPCISELFSFDFDPVLDFECPAVFTDQSNRFNDKSMNDKTVFLLDQHFDFEGEITLFLDKNKINIRKKYA